jgi:hypothetical protein
MKDHVDKLIGIVTHIVDTLAQIKPTESLDQSTVKVGRHGLFGELEHLKIETRLIDEMFTSVMGEYVFLK